MARGGIEEKVALAHGKSPEEAVERGAASFPLPRAGTTADVVDAVMFLISESSAWITGESINVDGGSLAGGFFFPSSFPPSPTSFFHFSIRHSRRHHGDSHTSPPSFPPKRESVAPRAGFCPSPWLP